MALDSILSIVITCLVVIFIVCIVILPFFVLWWWLNDRKIRRIARQYLESEDYIQDIKELKGGVNYGIQKERAEDRGTIVTGGNCLNPQNIKREYYGGLAKGNTNPQTISGTPNPSVDRNKRRVTLH